MSQKPSLQQNVQLSLNENWEKTFDQPNAVHVPENKLSFCMNLYFWPKIYLFLFQKILK